eukprot:scaffold7.g3605.t1
MERKEGVVARRGSVEACFAAVQAPPRCHHLCSATLSVALAMASELAAAALLIEARAPDPKHVKRGSLPFSSGEQGVALSSGSGFVLAGCEVGMPEQGAAVVCSLASLWPFLTPQSRAGALHAAALLPSTALHAALPCDRRVALALAGAAELPGVAGALRRLLAAPSTAGAGGWQVGWSLQPQAWAGGHEVAAVAHLALLTPTDAAGGAALGALAAQAHSPAAAGPPAPQSPALGRPAGPALRQGQRVAAVGAPFGALSPPHFSGFVCTGVVGATLPPNQAPPAREPASGGGGALGGGGADAPAPGRPALALLDMRCLPGLEGGPVYAAAQGCAAADARPAPAPAPGAPPGAAAAQGRGERWALAGMLLPPLRAPAAAAELAVLAPLPSVLAAARRAAAGGAGPGGARDAVSGGGRGSGSGDAGAFGSAAGRGPCPPPAGPLLEAPTSAGAGAAAAAAEASGGDVFLEALEAVVAIEVPGSWATGVVVSPAGHVLTNAHVLLPAGAAAAAARASGGGSGWGAAQAHARVCGPPVRMHPAPRRPRWPRPLAPSARAPAPGQQVCVAGWGVFAPRAGLGPLVTGGTLARVVPLGGPGSISGGGGGGIGRACGAPAMLLTTAAVHSGASGGAVLDPATGQLLGLVTSNSRHAASGGVLPHLNYAIPAALLAPVAAAAAEPTPAAARERWTQLDAAAAADAALRQAWQLGLAQRPEQPPHAAGDAAGDGGGGIHGARPPARLVSLLEQLKQQQRARL